MSPLRTESSTALGPFPPGPQEVVGLASSPRWWSERVPQAPEAPALLASDGWVASRQELARAVRATALTLGEQGITREDRLALVMAPGPAMAAALLGGMEAAAVAPLVPSLPEERVCEELQRLRATRLLVDGQPPAAVLKAASRLALPVLPLDPFQLPAASPGTFQSPAAGDLALLLQTSGTTTRPKVVPLSHANLMASARTVAEVLALGPEDRSLAAMPLFHIHGILTSLLAPLLAGGSVICCAGNAPGELLGLLPRLHPTWLSAVPTLLQALLTELDLQGEAPPPHRLRLLRSASAPLPPALLERLEAVFGVPVLEAYGMTEAAGPICSHRLPGIGADRRPGSVGTAAGAEVTVLDPQRRQQPVGVEGEVAIRGAGVTRGYEPEGSGGWIQTPDGGRWFLTGDGGWLDGEGRLTITGRLGDRINRGGEKVIPGRVDAALLLHPAVEQALAFAVPHPTLGEDLAAAVVLHPGAAALEQELRRHAFKTLAPHEVPSRIVLVEALPRGATGKLQRTGLAERLADVLHPSEEAASGELEELIADTIAAVLQRNRPGRDANFFLLGGDSLSGQRVILALGQQLALELSPTLLFAHPTVRCLAERLDALLDQALARLEGG